MGDIIVLKYLGRELIKRIEKIEGEHVFVVGDNHDESTDSRHFGSINIDNIVGKVVYGPNDIPCTNCDSPVIGIYGRKDAICQNCGFKLSCCGEP